MQNIQNNAINNTNRGKLITIDDSMMIGVNYDVKYVLNAISNKLNINSCEVIHFRHPIYNSDKILYNFLNNGAIVDIIANKLVYFNKFKKIYDDINNKLNEGKNVVVFNYITSYISHEIYTEFNNQYNEFYNSFKKNTELFIYALLSNVNNLKDLMNKAYINPNIINIFLKYVNVNRINHSFILVNNERNLIYIYHKINLKVHRLIGNYKASIILKNIKKNNNIENVIKVYEL